MSTTVEAPRTMVEAVANLRFPPRTDHRLRDLMDRNNNGCLMPTERGELNSLVELSETMALLRAEALLALGRSPR